MPACLLSSLAVKYTDRSWILHEIQKPPIYPPAVTKDWEGDLAGPHERTRHTCTHACSPHSQSSNLPIFGPDQTSEITALPASHHEGQGTSSHLTRHTCKTQTPSSHVEHKSQTHMSNTHIKHTFQAHMSSTKGKHTCKTNISKTQLNEHAKHTGQKHRPSTHAKHTDQTHRTSTHAKHMSQAHM